MKFAVMLEKCVSNDQFQKVVPDHVKYMTALHDRGVLIAGGPFLDGQGGMLLIEAESEDAARAIAEADPFVMNGVERHTLRKWEVLTDVHPQLLTRDGKDRARLARE